MDVGHVYRISIGSDGDAIVLATDMIGYLTNESNRRIDGTSSYYIAISDFEEFISVYPPSIPIWLRYATNMYVLLRHGTSRTQALSITNLCSISARSTPPSHTRTHLRPHRCAHRMTRRRDPLQLAQESPRKAQLKPNEGPTIHLNEEDATDIHTTRKASSLR